MQLNAAESFYERQLLVVAGQLRSGWPNIVRMLERAERSCKMARQTSDEAYVDSVVLNMHSIYAGLERLFELIANRIDESPAQGENWHQQVLARMAIEVPQVRPAMLS